MPAEALQAHFRSLFARADTVPTSIPQVTATYDENTELARSSLTREVSVGEVLGILDRLSRGRAPGPDLVRNDHLRDARLLAPCWARLMNECLHKGKIPDGWRSANLVILPKGKGNPAEPSSWRGIALKSCPYKVLAQLLTRRLTVFLEDAAAIPPSNMDSGQKSPRPRRAPVFSEK